MTATAKATIDWNKPVQAKLTNGKWAPAEVLCTTKNGEYSVVFLVRNPSMDVLGHSTPDGTAAYFLGGGHRTELRNTPAPPVPFEFVRWVNVYRGCEGQPFFRSNYATEEEAKKQAMKNLDGCQTVPVTIRGEWKDGESNG